MKKVLKPFKFGTMKTAADFEKTMTEAGLPFPVDENVDILAKPIQIGKVGVQLAGENEFAV